jgi:hypothetical protein
MNIHQYAMKCIWDEKFMRDSTYQLESDINAKLGGHRMHFKVEDRRFGNKFSGEELWDMKYGMSMNITKHGKQHGTFEIYFIISPWVKLKKFVVEVRVEPEKYQTHFSRMIKSSPSGNIEVDNIEKIPALMAKTMKRIQQWAKDPRPLW